MAAVKATKTAPIRRPTPNADPEVVSFADAPAWSRWLAGNHASSFGVWLKIAKKGSKVASVDYAEALEVALAWGWIDGQKGKLDGTWWLQRFTPRGPRSTWSKINRDRALALIEAGTMKPAGLAEVERAKKDGRWGAAYDSQSRSTVPPDLAKALAANPRAAAFFETLESYNRYAILFRIHTAKKPETRAARIEKFVAMLAKHEKVHPPRRSSRSRSKSGS
jgi:uncharacterized protein YdeI (YjbR/CyaY-like superfamily)